jgi:hypothetical protein
MPHKEKRAPSGMALRVPFWSDECTFSLSNKADSMAKQGYVRGPVMVLLLSANVPLFCCCGPSGPVMVKHA